MSQVTFNEEDGQGKSQRKKQEPKTPNSKLADYLIARGFAKDAKQANMVLLGIAVVALIFAGVIAFQGKKSPVYNHVQNIPPEQI